MSLKLFIVSTALALLLVLTSAHPLPNQRRDIAPFDGSLEDRALFERTFALDDSLEPRTPPPPGGWRTSAQRKADHKAAGKPVKKSRATRNAARATKGKAALPTRKANNKARAADRRAKKARGEALPSLNKAGKKPPPPRGTLREKATVAVNKVCDAARAATCRPKVKRPNPYGAIMQKHVADTRAAKYKAKNDARNASLKKAGHGPTEYGASKKGLKDAKRKEQRAYDKEMNGKKAAHVTAPANAAAINRAKAARRAQFADAKTKYDQSIATGTFPARNAQFVTPKGTYNGKDVRQAAFTAHLNDGPGRKVGFQTATGRPVKSNAKHPKTFRNDPQGPPPQTPPLPVIPAGQPGYREYGMLHDKPKGYDGATPNPTAARLITKPNAAGVHEFAGVVAHPNVPEGDPAYHDHLVIPPT